MQKQRVGMTVEMVGIIYVQLPDGFVTTEIAAQLGIDPNAGWRIMHVETMIGQLGPGRTTVKLVRDVPFDIARAASVA